MPDEHDIIAECFVRDSGESVLVGSGDDAAVVRVGDAMNVVCSTDTLVEGTHFAHNTRADALGHKALAVNLSDFAAMGAMPKWALVALTLPQADKGWCRRFADGFFALAERHGVDLIGGDLTRGPLTVTVQLLGVQEGPVLRRHGAQVGDKLYLTGDIGDAALAYSRPDADLPESCRRRLDCPTPRVTAGLVIARYATAGLDISDGLIVDLERLLERCGAEINIDNLPLGEECARVCKKSGDYTLPLTGGDDYELLFTVPRARENELRNRVGALPENEAVALTCIGDIVETPGVRAFLKGSEYALPKRRGFDHFRKPQS